MKRLGYLWEKVCSLENIAAAHDKARKGKAHYSAVKTVESDREKYFGVVRDMLVEKSFENAPYEIMTLAEGPKVREIWKLPYFPDRIIHHCIVQVMEPYWMRTLIRDTYAALPGRGVHDGVKRVQKSLQNDPDGTRFCLKLDVKSNWQVFPVDVRGIDFLGYRFFGNYTLVRKRIVQGFKHRLRKGRSEKALAAYKGWFIHANTYRLRRKYELRI